MLRSFYFCALNEASFHKFLNGLLSKHQSHLLSFHERTSIVGHAYEVIDLIATFKLLVNATVSLQIDQSQAGEVLEKASVHRFDFVAACE